MTKSPPFLLSTPALEDLFGVPAKTIRGYIRQRLVAAEKREGDGRDTNLIDRFAFEDLLITPLSGRYQRKAVSIPIAQVKTDPSVQTREGLTQSAVLSFARELEYGIIHDPILLYGSAEEGFYPGDGNHRHAGAVLRGSRTIRAFCFPGGHDVALERSLRSNHKHGLQRTNADKRRCVIQALAIYCGCEFSNNRVAVICGVSDMLVASVRNDLSTNAIEKNNEVSRTERLPQLDAERLGAMLAIRDSIAPKIAALASVAAGSNPLLDARAMADLFCVLGDQLRSLTRCSESALIRTARKLAGHSTSPSVLETD